LLWLSLPAQRDRQVIFADEKLAAQPEPTLLKHYIVAERGETVPKQRADSPSVCAEHLWLTANEYNWDGEFAVEET